MIGRAIHKSGMYTIQSENNYAYSTSCREMWAMLWHCIAGHPSHKVLRRMVYSSIGDIDVCEACIKAKMSRLSFPTLEFRTNRCFDIIHSNIWDSSPVDGFNNQ